MGNQIAKIDNVNESVITARCPQRNRNIKIERTATTNEGLRRQYACSKTLINQKFKNEGVFKHKTLQKSSKRFLDTQAPPPMQVSSLNSLRLDRNIKVRRKRRIKRCANEEAKKTAVQQKLDGNAKPSDASKDAPYTKVEKRKPTQLTTENDINLISDLFNTVAEMETTFLDEKKYDRRLRTAFSKQIERMQHLELSLHIEKERNRRLMELMSRYDSSETVSYNQNDKETSKNLTNFNNSSSKLQAIDMNNRGNCLEKSKWSYQQTFSRATDTPISPLLLQQRYDDLSKSFGACQIELKQKDKLLTLAHCKREALQAKCDRLTEQLLASQRKVQSLQRKNSNVRMKRIQGQMSDSFDSDDSAMGTTEGILDKSSEVVSQNRENACTTGSSTKHSLRNKTYLSNSTDLFMFGEGGEIASKTKAE